MNTPRATALCVITRERPQGREFLVQCADDEAFYRFPGGGIDFGETAAAAIRREMREEYDFDVNVGPLWIVNENIFVDRDLSGHEVGLIHMAELEQAMTVDELRHKEHADVKLVWRSPAAWATKPVYPAGIAPYLRAPADGIVHLVSPTADPKLRA
jgi:ADP-ribose pyrophosphatase YjhB (NUDIX family)